MNIVTTMNISLPESMKAFVRERAESADFSNPSDYIRTLIRADKAQAELEALLLDGLNSGEPDVLTESDMARFEQIIAASDGC